MHAAGIVEQSRLQRQFGNGLHMQYLNQFGNETIMVTAAPQVFEEVLENPPGRRPTHAIVELQIEAGGVYLYAAAQLVRRQQDRLTSVDGITLESQRDFSAWLNSYSLDPENYSLVFAYDTSVDLGEPRTGPAFAQLFIDLTSFPTEKTALVDIYAQARVIPYRTEAVAYTDVGETAIRVLNNHPASQGLYPVVTKLLIGATSGNVVAFNAETTAIAYENTLSEFVYHNVGLFINDDPERRYLVLDTIGSGTELTTIYYVEDRETLVDTGYVARIGSEENVGTNRLSSIFVDSDYTVSSTRIPNTLSTFGLMYFSDPLRRLDVDTQPVRSHHKLALTGHDSAGSNYDGPVRSVRWRYPSGAPVQLPRLAATAIIGVDQRLPAIYRALIGFVNPEDIVQHV